MRMMLVTGQGCRLEALQLTEVTAGCVIHTMLGKMSEVPQGPARGLALGLRV